MKYFFILLIFTSCAAPTSKNHEKLIQKPELKNKLKLDYSKLIPKINIDELFIGKVKKLHFTINPKLKDFKILCTNIGELKVEISNNEVITYLPIPYHYESKEGECFILVESSKYSFFKFNVIPVKYKEKYLNVAKRHVDLPKKALERWLKEKKLQEEIYSTPAPQRLFQKHFSKPLNSYVTSPYGSKRVFNNKKDSWHSGTDFRAPIGTKIPATNRGVVRFAGSLYFNGNTIILDHGLGIYTMYCHLSKLSVQENEIIPKGEIIGLSGNTGRSTGPHLHWGVKVNGHWIDSSSLVEDKFIQ